MDQYLIVVFMGWFCWMLQNFQILFGENLFCDCMNVWYQCNGILFNLRIKGVKDILRVGLNCKEM